MAKKTKKNATSAHKPNKSAKKTNIGGNTTTQTGYVKVAIAEDYQLAMEYIDFLKIYHIHAKTILINPEDFYSYAIVVPAVYYDKSYDLIDRRSTNRDSDPAVFADEEDSLDTETDEFSSHDNLRDYHIYIDPHRAA
jgi:hypothetical protein